MVSLDADLTPAEAAALYEGLAHPARVAAIRALRPTGQMSMAQLRKVVSEAHREVDARTMRFHVGRMAAAGLVDVRSDGEVILVLDVTVKLRLPATG